MQPDTTGEAGNVTEQTQQVCCVCEQPVSPPYNIIGQRIYCDHHFAIVNKQHRGFWRSAIVQIVGMGLFSAVVYFLADYIGPLDDPWRLPVGVALVLVPSAAWLYYFYRQDRLEPEPKARVMQVFLLAVLLTEAIGYPLFRWFRMDEWANSLTVISLAASVLVPGFIWQAINYTSVRMLVYATPEFDERMDGVVYGSMAGLGVATLLNLHFVLDNGGVALGTGVVHIVTTLLAQASFGGITGYFMAQAKFEHKPVWWVPVGVVVSAILNGLFRWLVSEVSADGLMVAPWRSLVFGLAVALVSFGALLWLMQQALRKTAPTSSM
ncbi:MAG TPA: PrsW family glutamic-type intramembrane protease [Chloroflexia bacterium]|nr:PrsW family glutamic-type intramembrane protease [Chloroflexia bacterium]